MTTLGTSAVSNIGQAVLTVVGAIVGVLLAPETGGASLAITYAVLGASIGLTVGSFLFPTRLPPVYGPQLLDHNTTSSALGDPVSIGYGTFPVTGTVMFLDQIVETSVNTTQGGKGGGPQQTTTTYNYNQSIGIGLCEGPILGILRIWENGELVYDVRPIQPGEAFSAYSKRVATSNVYAGTFVLYFGTEDQLADPTIELQQGVGNVPAFRGLAYIMYPNRLLLLDQGLRHPTFKFEIFKTATTTSAVLAPTFTGAPPSFNAQAPLVVNIAGGVYYFIGDVSGTNVVFEMNIATNTEVARNSTVIPPINNGNSLALTADGAPIVAGLSGGPNAEIIKLDPVTLLPTTSYLPYDASSVTWLHYNAATLATPNGPVNLLLASGTLMSVTLTNTDTLAQLKTQNFSPDSIILVGNIGGSPVSFYFVTYVPTSSGPGGTLTVNLWYVFWDTSNPLFPAIAVTASVTCTVAPSAIDPAWIHISSFGDALMAPDGHIIGNATSSGATNAAYYFKFNPATGAVDWATPVLNGSVYDFGVTNSVITGTTLWVEDGGIGGGNRGVLAINTVSGVITSINLNSELPSNTPDGTSWAVPGFVVSQLFGLPGFYIIGYNRSTPGDVRIADIVADLCTRSACPYDVSSITESVPGFVITATPMAARNAIVPLRSVGFFDACESADVMRFVARGAAISQTLSANDLGAFDASDTQSAKDPAPANSVAVSMEMDLPQQIRVNYMAVSRDHQPRDAAVAGALRHRLGAGFWT